MATIACHYVKAALGGAILNGFDADELLVKSGINPRVFAYPTGRISDSQMTRLVQRIWWLMEDEFMGFTATPCKQGTFALVVDAVSRCSNLREVFRLGIRMYNLIHEEVQTELREEDGIAFLNTRFMMPKLDPDHFYTEFWLVIWHRFSSWLIDRKISLIHAELAYSKPDHSAELSYLFPCPKHFDCAQNQLAFESHYLNLPPIRSRSEIRAFLKHSPAGLMTIPGDDRSLRNKVTNFIMSKSKPVLKLPGINQTASHFHMTAQTFHRKLKKEGTSYQLIKDGIRRDISVNKLVKHRLPVKDVAEIVGFSEPRSFTRAFKHWTGLSPREYCKYV